VAIFVRFVRLTFVRVLCHSQLHFICFFFSCFLCWSTTSER